MIGSIVRYIAVTILDTKNRNIAFSNNVEFQIAIK
jgi:hypothetical protein